jgi:hypothetical protein
MIQNNGQKAQGTIVAASSAGAAGAMRNAAPAPTAAAEITVDQEKAIVLMGSGKSVSEAARETGVGRATLYRWLRDDPAFIAAWNAWRREQGLATRARLLGVAAEAAESVREAVRKDGRLALTLLKEMGLVKAEEAGSDDAAVIKEEKEWEERERKVQSDLAKAILSRTSVADNRIAKGKG